jgi:protein-L-isoaspartate(D-aspartate) O-methyltransferase
MMPLELRRRFYAEEIAATANLQSAALVDALATVPREQFLGAGPWTVRGEADFQAPPRRTSDADPRHVYHNYAIALDEPRLLFNGAPGLLAMAIDRLAPQPGESVFHLGAGTGYYTALMAACVGPSGRVVAVEVDDALAATARANTASMPWVEVRHGDGSADPGGPFDAVLINAGVTHPLDAWLDALSERGRMIVPLTVAMAPTIGKGLLAMLARRPDDRSLDARTLTFVAIYNALKLRDESIARELGAAMAKNPLPPLKRLRRDPHDPGLGCWLHRAGCCLSTSETVRTLDALWGDGEYYVPVISAAPPGLLFRRR